MRARRAPRSLPRVRLDSAQGALLASDDPTQAGQALAATPSEPACVSRYRHVRCDHWMPVGWCTQPNCPHWDGLDEEATIVASDPSAREQAAVRARAAKRAATVDPEEWCLPDPDWI